MSCLFCSIESGDGRHCNPEDVVLAANEIAFAKPGLGHFVDGYTLVIPRMHVTSLAELEPEELERVDLFRKTITHTLQRLYGRPVLAFEHGCGQVTRAGACIEHAHLHLLPMPEQCKNVKRPLESRAIGKTISCLAELAGAGSKTRGYIYMEEPGIQAMVFEINHTLPSQFIRRVICEQCTLGPDVWDWRINPFRERIMKFSAAWLRNEKEQRIAAP